LPAFPETAPNPIYDPVTDRHLRSRRSTGEFSITGNT